MTLIEAVVVIAILGVIAAGLAVFLINPVRGYSDTVLRTQLAESADFALRRIARELGGALPNSPRSTVSGKDFVLEFLNVRSAARYCNGVTVNCGGSLFDGDNSFAWYSPGGLSIDIGNFIVVGNDVNNGCDAYSATTINRRTVSALTGNSISFSGAALDGNCIESSHRFFVVSGPVAYACDAANSTLWRYSGYTIQATIPVSIAALDGLSGVIKARLATGVQCASSSFNVSNTNENLIELRMQLKSTAGETVNLYRQVRMEQAL